MARMELRGWEWGEAAGGHLCQDRGNRAREFKAREWTGVGREHDITPLL